MENHHFQWENPLSITIFNSYVKLPEGTSIPMSEMPSVMGIRWISASTCQFLADSNCVPRKATMASFRRLDLKTRAWMFLSSVQMWWKCLVFHHEKWEFCQQWENSWKKYMGESSINFMMFETVGVILYFTPTTLRIWPNFMLAICWGQFWATWCSPKESRTTQL